MNKRKKDKSVISLVEGQGLRKSGVVMALDVHKEGLQYCIATEKNVLEENLLENNKKGLEKLVRAIKERNVKSVAMESTSQYHVKVAYYLLENDVPILVANPQQTKQTQGKKTDAWDARRMVIAHRDGRLQPSVIPHYDYWMLRKATRKLALLTNEATKNKQRLSQLFHQKDFPNNRLLSSKTGLELLALVSNGTISEENAKKVVARSSKKKIMLSEIDTIDLKQFQESLKPMERITFGSEITQLRTNKLLQEQQQLVYLEFAKKDERFRKNVELLLSIPGIGPDTAAIALSEIADVSYFETPANLIKWTGLAPKIYQSGHRKNVTGKLHKGGNKYLRRALVLAAQNIYAKIKDNPIHRFMREKKESREAQTHKSAYWLAICAGARKLLVYIYYILKNQTPWQLLEVPEDMVRKAKEYLNKKVTKFYTKACEYERARDSLAEQLSAVISGISVPELSPQYLIRQLLKKIPPKCYT